MGARAYGKKISGAVGGTLKISQVSSWSFRESGVTGSPAIVLLRRGNVSGDVLIAIHLSAAASDHAEYGSPVDFSSDDNGAHVAGQTVFVDIATGTVEGGVHGW